VQTGARTVQTGTTYSRAWCSGVVPFVAAERAEPVAAGPPLDPVKHVACGPQLPAVLGLEHPEQGASRVPEAVDEPSCRALVIFPVVQLASVVPADGQV
jgi:hypothetical protein